MMIVILFEGESNRTIKFLPSNWFTRQLLFLHKLALVLEKKNICKNDSLGWTKVPPSNREEGLQLRIPWETVV